MVGQTFYQGSYVYADNNPIMMNDPTGMTSEGGPKQNGLMGQGPVKNPDQPERHQNAAQGPANLVHGTLQYPTVELEPVDIWGEKSAKETIGTESLLKTERIGPGVDNIGIIRQPTPEMYDANWWGAAKMDVSWGLLTFFTPFGAIDNAIATWSNPESTFSDGVVAGFDVFFAGAGGRGRGPRGTRYKTTRTKSPRTGRKKESTNTHPTSQRLLKNAETLKTGGKNRSNSQIF